MKHTYETTWESEDDLGNVIGSLELRINYTYSPGSEDHYDASIGGPGGWSPGDPAELEITDIETETGYGTPTPGIVKVRWALVDAVLPENPTGETWHDYLSEWAMSEHADNMHEQAVSDILYEREAAAEYAAEEIREAKAFRAN